MILEFKKFNGQRNDEFVYLNVYQISEIYDISSTLGIYTTKIHMASGKEYEIAEEINSVLERIKIITKT